MTEPTIVCPSCKTEIKLTESLAASLWAKREEQIRGVIRSTAGMYGDLQDIARKTVQEIEGLEVNFLSTDPIDAP